MANEKIYPDGLFVDQKETSFGTIDKLSIQVDKFIKFLNEHKNAKGYVNLDMLTSKDGEKKYAVLNTFQPKQQGVDISSKGDEDDLLPF